jgi:hypothetical protein
MASGRTEAKQCSGQDQPRAGATVAVSARIGLIFGTHRLGLAPPFHLVIGPRKLRSSAQIHPRWRASEIKGLADVTPIFRRDLELE